jgi:hypothetical protein
MKGLATRSATGRRLRQVRMQRCSTRERTASGDGGPEQVESAREWTCRGHPRFPFGRLLGQQMQKLRPNRELEILNLGSQPDSVLFRGHAQLIATGYETSTAGQVTTALPETRKILVEHRAKEPSVITLLCRMYRCCINTHAELISIRIPCFANLSLPSRAIFSLRKRAVTTDDVSATAVSNSNA